MYRTSPGRVRDGWFKPLERGEKQHEQSVMTVRRGVCMVRVVRGTLMGNIGRI